MNTCKTCKEPVVFVVLVGWTHLTWQDHDVRI